ncbi:hypothetical protein KAS50_06255, partial [bacterium]|nr:hypothetical protein [bacterium]
MRNFISFLFCMGIVCTAYGQTNYNVLYGDIELVISDNNRIIFDYYPRVEKEYKNLRDGQYVFYNVLNCGYGGDAGHPMMPERYVNIGLPIDGSARISVT